MVDDTDKMAADYVEILNMINEWMNLFLNGEIDELEFADNMEHMLEQLNGNAVELLELLGLEGVHDQEEEMDPVMEVPDAVEMPNVLVPDDIDVEYEMEVEDQVQDLGEQMGPLEPAQAGYEIVPMAFADLTPALDMEAGADVIDARRRAALDFMHSFSDAADVVLTIMDAVSRRHVANMQLLVTRLDEARDMHIADKENMTGIMTQLRDMANLNPVDMPALLHGINTMIDAGNAVRTRDQDSMTALRNVSDSWAARGLRDEDNLRNVWMTMIDITRVVMDSLRMMGMVVDVTQLLNDIHEMMNLMVERRDTVFLRLRTDSRDMQELLNCREMYFTYDMRAIFHTEMEIIHAITDGLNM